MREKDHFLGIDAGLLEDVAEHLDHALGDAARIGVRGQHREPPDHLVGRIVDQDGLGEGAADVDTDAIGAARRRRFSHRLTFLVYCSEPSIR